MYLLFCWSKRLCFMHNNFKAKIFICHMCLSFIWSLLLPWSWIVTVLPKTSKLRITYNSLPESLCYGNFELLKLFQRITKYQTSWINSAVLWYCNWLGLDKMVVEGRNFRSTGFPQIPQWVSMSLLKLNII